MRVLGLALLTSIVIGAAAVAGYAASPGNSAEAANGSGPQDLSGITFNLAAPAFGKVERLPDAAQLRDLSAGTVTRPVASEEIGPGPTPPEKPRLAARPRVTGRSAVSETLKLAATPAPELAPKPKPKALAAAVPALGPDGKPISAWRRAYILKHGRQPPSPPR